MPREAYQESSSDQDDDAAGGLDRLSIKGGNLVLDLLEWERLRKKYQELCPPCAAGVIIDSQQAWQRCPELQQQRKTRRSTLSSHAKYKVSIQLQT